MNNLDTLLLRRRVERLLASWRRADRAWRDARGGAADASLSCMSSAGMASIELGVPIGPATTFRIASVSKQFTCAAILLLAAEGRLSIDDDVRAHIPALPDLGHRITLAHLMHNTSGIRDMLEIMRLGGADLGQPCKPEDLLDGVCRQRGLNFVPGSRYLYSNSNFMLLGRIVEQVSGQSLREFLDRRIFAPLGMNATRHVERTSEVVPNLATGYFPAPRRLGAGAARFPAAWRRRAGFMCYRSCTVACELRLATGRRHGAGECARHDDAVQQRPAQYLRARPAHQDASRRAHDRA